MLLNAIFLIIVLLCLTGWLADSVITEYMRTNPSEEDGAVRITFDEFLRLVKTQGDQISANWSGVEYCNTSGLAEFPLSFGIIDWFRYRRWLLRESKEEQKTTAHQHKKIIDKALSEEE